MSERVCSQCGKRIISSADWDGECAFCESLLVDAMQEEMYDAMEESGLEDREVL